MEISSVNSDLIRGNVTTIILGSLWSCDRYGYDILKEIDTKSGGQYNLKQPTLYNQLKRLEKQGLIASYEGDPDDTGGGRRRYYSLTAEGRAFLQKEKSEYEYSRTILDKLVSSQEFDFENTPAPFNAEGLRPYAKKESSAEKPKVIYKEKVVEVEKVVEKKVYLDAYGNEISEEEAKALASLPEASYGKPEASLSEIFARIDSKDVTTQQNITSSKEDKKHPEVEKNASAENTYFNANRSETPRRQTTLKEIFDKLENEAAADSAAIKSADAVSLPDSKANGPEFTQQIVQNVPMSEKDVYADAELVNKRTVAASDAKDQFVTSSVINPRNDAFEFEKENVNYRDFFASIASPPEIKSETEKSKIVPPETDLKTRLYSQGFKVRPYDRGNTSEYYTFNFLQSNRIRRDSWLIVLAFYLVEVAVMWISLSNEISYVYFLSFLLGGAALMLFPAVICILNPTKRTRANFNFKLSLINRGMIFIELTVVAILVGFFAVGASVNDTNLILQTMILPMILLTNLPISSLVYWLLYRTRRYHIA